MASADQQTEGFSVKQVGTDTASIVWRPDDIALWAKVSLAIEKEVFPSGYRVTKGERRLATGGRRGKRPVVPLP